jgi:hypothetical protein
MERYRPLRNVAIVIALGVGVYFIPGGGRAAETIEAALWVLFGVGIAYMALRLYRERRYSIAGLGDPGRALLYAVIGLVLFLFAARWWLEIGGLRELLWFVLALAGVWAAMDLYRRWRTF